VAFGSPTRFGNIAAQLKQFIDQAGALWQAGKLADKVATSFTASQTAHGGQETTILALHNTLYHWGMLILPLGYTVSEVFAAGGNPYGASFVTGHTVTGPDEGALAVARYQGRRLATFAAVIAEARRNGAFAVQRPSPESFTGPTNKE
jgi:NAD(P)H dehydrogenase (quinone)